jgi:hypothetical protein
MDSATFDLLTRSVSTSVTRRRIIALLSSLGLAGFASSPFGASAKPCKGNKKKCGGKCIPKKDCCTNKECDKKIAGQVCKNGNCTCPGRTKKCGKKCIANDVCCAAGERGCPYYEVCEDGTCRNCLGEDCGVPEDCCTGQCELFSGCFCYVGNSSGCTSDRNCCNGSCNTATGQCDCDPNGSPCGNGFGCCSGNCVDEKCVA